MSYFGRNRKVRFWLGNDSPLAVVIAIVMEVADLQAAKRRRGYASMKL